MPSIDLNSDLGEGFGHWSLGDDDALLGVVTSANVACGFHAGDASIMRTVCHRAAEHGVAIGAQVGYRDLPGFGRRFIDIEPEALTQDVIYQVGALQAFARIAGSRVSYVKPHGALYNAIVHHEEQAAAVVAAILDLDATLPVLGLPGSAWLRLAQEAGLRTVSEAFADRAYTPEGTLVSRRLPGAVLTDADAIARALCRDRNGRADHRRRGRRPDPERGLDLRARGHRRRGRHRASGEGRARRRRGHRRPVRRLMRVLPSGSTALLVELDDLDAVLALYAALVENVPDGVVDIVPAARTLLLVTDPAVTALSAVELAVRSAQPREDLRDWGETLEIPVTYDGEDLEETATLLDCEPAELVQRHTEAEWTVAFCGFIPGFGYLTSPSWTSEVPRRSSPRKKVPPGSVALAGEFSGVYPRESPGGWQLIGRTGLTMFDPARDPAALLRPGARIRFVDDGARP